jgi:hypothetical protein
VHEVSVRLIYYRTVVILNGRGNFNHCYVGRDVYLNSIAMETGTALSDAQRLMFPKFEVNVLAEQMRSKDVPHNGNIDDEIDARRGALQSITRQTPAAVVHNSRQ